MISINLSSKQNHQDYVIQNPLLTLTLQCLSHKIKESRKSTNINWSILSMSYWISMAQDFGS